MCSDVVEWTIGKIESSQYGYFILAPVAVIGSNFIAPMLSFHTLLLNYDVITSAAITDNRLFPVVAVVLETVIICACLWLLPGTFAPAIISIYCFSR